MSHPTEIFLRAYTGLKNPAITFVTMRNGEPGKPMYNTRLSDALSTLCALNKTGSDIFFSVNVMDGQGRRHENIVAARTVYADYDAGVPESWLLAPSLIVESSPGKAQAYWVLDRGEPADERWHAAERGVVWATGADKNVCDAARVLRLPGFINHKYPSLPAAKLLVSSDRRWMLNQIEEAWPPLAAPEQPVAGKIIENVADEAKLRRYDRWLLAAEVAPSTSGRLPVSRNWLFRKAAAGVRDFDLPVQTVAEALCRRIATLDWNDALSFAKDADRYATNVRGSAYISKNSSLAMEM